jgi:hypothetical protein
MGANQAGPIIMHESQANCSDELRGKKSLLGVTEFHKCYQRTGVFRKGEVTPLSFQAFSC